MAHHDHIYGYFTENKRFYSDHIAQDDPNFFEFLERNPDPLSQPGILFVGGKSLLHKAVETYDEALVRRIIEEKAISLTEVDDNDLTPLMTACALSPNSLDFPALREIFFALLEALPKKCRFNPFSRNVLNAVDIRDNSALEICFFAENLLFASELIRRGARTRTVYEHLNLLHFFSVIPSELGAAEPPGWAGSVERYKQIHTELAYLLYRKKISPFVLFFGTGSTPLYTSIIHYNATLFKILLGADSMDEDLMAVKNSMKKKIKQYYTLGGFFDTESNPIYACIEYVIRHEADAMKQYSRNWMLRMLIFAGADVNIVSASFFFRSPLQLYMRLMPDFAELQDDGAWDLIDSGADLNYVLEKDIFGFGPNTDESTFETSLRCGDHRIVEKILQDTNADVNGRVAANFGQRPVEVVCDNYRYYAGLYARDREAVHINFEEWLKVLDVLVRHGCDLDFKRVAPLDLEVERGRATPIHHISEIFSTICFNMSRDNYEQYHLCQKLISRLIELGANVNFSRLGGPNLLVIAVHQDLNAVSRELLRHGANLDFSYKLGACSRAGDVPHRIQSYEGLAELAVSMGQEPENMVYICDVCQRRAPPNYFLKMCDNHSCDTMVCEECFMFTQHEETDSTEVLNIAKRRANCGLISMLNFAHTSVGRRLVEEQDLYHFDVLQNAGLDSEKFLYALTSENLQQMGLTAKSFKELF